MSTRRVTLIAMLAGAALAALPIVSGHAPRFIWNASASVPIGLYSLGPVGVLDVGDLVAVLPPDDLAAFLDARGYLPRGLPLIKRVLALPGTEVCRHGPTVIAYDHAYVDAQPRDRFGRDLPQWQGCRVIAAGEIFLLNWDSGDSLDGRYFGALPASTVIGRACPLYTDEHGDGRFRWRFTNPALSRDLPRNRTTGDDTMADLGSFTRTETGFKGRFEALGIEGPLTFVPAKPSEAENAPAYRILLGDETGRDIGAGWSHVGEKAGEFVSIEIYSPVFGWLRANLFRDGDDDTAWSLHSNEPKKKKSEG